MITVQDLAAFIQWSDNVTQDACGTFQECMLMTVMTSTWRPAWCDVIMCWLVNANSFDRDTHWLSRVANGCLSLVVHYIVTYCDYTVTHS